jgi:hypothetical protein
MRSLPEIRSILSEYTTGPIVASAAKDALRHAEHYRELAIQMRIAAVKCDRLDAERWVDDQAD